MASDYGLNFGWRRSDPLMREGRQRVPAAGTFKAGDLVTFDPANPGFIMTAPADTPIEPGYTGILIQEDAWDIPLNGNQILMSYDLDVIHNGALCAITTGAGGKFWVKNTLVADNIGQRHRDAVTKVTATGLVIGSLIGWDGTKYRATADPLKAIGKVTLTNGADYAEIVLAK